MQNTRFTVDDTDNTGEQHSTLPSFPRHGNDFKMKDSWNLYLAKSPTELLRFLYAESHKLVVGRGNGRLSIVSEKAHSLTQ
jgi:hypothetical protein